MNTQPGERKTKSSTDNFRKTVEVRSRRRIKAAQDGKESPWFGLGMFGLVGWSIALPAVLGVLLGSWLDARWPSQISWKLTLLFLGVFVGFSVACYWMRKEFDQ